MADGPLIVQSDKTLLLEVDHPDAPAALAPLASDVPPPPVSTAVVSGIRPPAVVTQPEADEVTAAFGVGPVLELGAAMAERAVVDKLDFAGLELEIDRQLMLLENVERRGERGGAFIVERLAAHLVAAVDLVGAKA